MADDPGRRRKKPKSRKGGARKKKGRPKGGCQPCSDQRLTPALKHKFRRQMLRRLHQSEEPMSPAQLSLLLDVQVTNLSYHMDVLRNYCVVKLVDEQPVRGAIEHFYESKVADSPIVQAILEETRAEDEERLESDGKDV